MCFLAVVFLFYVGIVELLQSNFFFNPIVLSIERVVEETISAEIVEYILLFFFSH